MAQDNHTQWEAWTTVGTPRCAAGRVNRHRPSPALIGGHSFAVSVASDAEDLCPVAYSATLTCRSPSRPFHRGDSKPEPTTRLLKYLPSFVIANKRSLCLLSSAINSIPMAGQVNASKSASRVSLDHFDPEGVQQLSRALSKSSGQQGPRSVRSDGTLAPDEPFSLEKILRSAFDRYVL